MTPPTRSHSAKALALRARIAEAAIGLFLAHGFDPTTVEAIAAAAGTSRRSVFRYFATKEDMALSWTTATGPALAKQVLEFAHLAQRQPIQAALLAVQRHVVQHQELHSLSLAVGQLIDRTPSLRAREHEKYLLWEELLANALLTRGAAPTPGRMAAALALAGLRLAVREWLAGQGKAPLAELLAAAYQPFLQLTKPTPQPPTNNE